MNDYKVTPRIAMYLTQIYDAVRNQGPVKWIDGGKSIQGVARELVMTGTREPYSNAVDMRDCDLLVDTDNGEQALHVRELLSWLHEGMIYI